MSCAWCSETAEFQVKDVLDFCFLRALGQVLGQEKSLCQPSQSQTVTMILSMVCPMASPAGRFSRTSCRHPVWTFVGVQDCVRAGCQGDRGVQPLALLVGSRIVTRPLKRECWTMLPLGKGPSENWESWFQPEDLVGFKHRETLLFVVHLHHLPPQPYILRCWRHCLRVPFRFLTLLGSGPSPTCSRDGPSRGCRSGEAASPM